MIAVRAGSAPRGVGVVGVAVLATFLGAALGFAVQPMVGRMLLPRLGGTAAVWNTTLVFFQAMLLGGYALTHLTSTRCSVRTQVRIHLGLLLLAAVFLPIRVRGSFSPPEAGNPSLWLLAVLAGTVGVPYLAIATTSPLIQRWFSMSSHRRAGDPYFLYAVSNAGSLLGLLAYPLVLEPRLGLRAQARGWAFAYGVFFVAAVALVLLGRSATATAGVSVGQSTPAETEARPPGLAQRLRWIGIAAIPSSLILGVTTHITTDVASVPLMWVVPLALYLLSYIIAFGRRNIPVRLRLALLGLAAGAATAAWLVDVGSLLMAASLHLAVLFAVGLACHARLADERPTPAYLTQFYLSLSIGGMVGGALTALLAPLVFKRIVEYPVALVLALTVVGVRRRRIILGLAALPVIAAVTVWFARRMETRPVLFAIVLALLGGAFLLTRRGTAFAVVVATIAVLSHRDITGNTVRFERSFYGAFHVDQDDKYRSLIHGTTLHGYQFIDPTKRRVPTSYYGRTGPLGTLLDVRRTAGAGALGHIGVVGLGVGTIAAYTAPGDDLTYYEIDSRIVRVARDRRLFTFLADARSTVHVVLGDGRRSLARRLAVPPDDPFDVLLIDAFTSDAIPVHLLTREAVQIYVGSLTPGGVLAIHISNNYMDLEPVVSAVARDLGLHAMLGAHDATEKELANGTESSSWIALATDEAVLNDLRHRKDWTPLKAAAGFPAWTDERIDLLRILHLR